MIVQRVRTFAYASSLLAAVATTGLATSVAATARAADAPQPAVHFTATVDGVAVPVTKIAGATAPLPPVTRLPSAPRPGTQPQTPKTELTYPYRSTNDPFLAWSKAMAGGKPIHKDVAIAAINPDGSVAHRFVLMGAVVASYTISPMTAGGSQIKTVTVTLASDRIVEP